ncbi:ROK family transcriptional regulator [Acuticoccus sediminis]|uniref:ROK family transcriptional regulator n=1 Tax=Acuticoccus sediminis TaxID=2184697 RepID=A0A8B2NLH8_9HYPH|nr:ROK family transcriptional regulator [Acuticoccus sediminis]RAH97315.1 ROK family transcriptional regulator [Acuticoccus sediminis]
MNEHLLRFPAHSHSRRSSLRTVLREVVRAGAISRAELSRRTGLSKQTMSDIVRDLLEEDWLRAVGQQRGAVGRSATNYELNPSRCHVWGGDLGGTSLRVCIADLTGRTVAEAREPTEPAGGEAVVNQIVALVGRLAASRGLPLERIACGAIGVPGAYDRQSRRLSLVTNVAGLDRMDLEAVLGARLGMTVFAENDVTLAANGELSRGSPWSTGTFAFLAMGTGVGLGLVSEGQIVRGARGAAGEIAWLPLGGDPFDSRNFHAGTLERAISSVAILERYRAYGGPKDASMIALFDAYNAGAPAAARVLDEVARTLAVVIVAIRALLDPEAVVFGGSIGVRPELLALVRAQLARCMPDPVPVEASRLGGKAAEVGAVAMAISHVHDLLLSDLPATPEAFDPAGARD